MLDVKVKLLKEMYHVDLDPEAPVLDFRKRVEEATYLPPGRPGVRNHTVWLSRYDYIHTCSTLFRAKYFLSDFFVGFFCRNNLERQPFADPAKQPAS